MMDRRTFIGGLASGLVVATSAAQQTMRVPRIGVLNPGSAGTNTDALRQGLQELGYVEGRTIIIEWRWWEGKPERLREVVAELVRLDLDVIVVGGVRGDQGLEGSDPVDPDRIQRPQLSDRGRTDQELRAAG
ncbi:MAG: hypothetical protein U1F54_17130 [Burkholderiales bacterium]